MTQSSNTPGADLLVISAIVSVVLSLYVYLVRGEQRRGIFVGLWPSTIIAFASYLKLRSIAARLSDIGS
ncbi:MAG: hypothetical protein ACLFR6_05235 [Salinarchaeum sp.]